MDRFGIGEVYGMHNWPGIRSDSCHSQGPLMAAADRFNIRIHGRGAPRRQL
jgi:hippurate hydrolase